MFFSMPSFLWLRLTWHDIKQYCKSHNEPSPSHYHLNRWDFNHLQIVGKNGSQGWDTMRHDDNPSGQGQSFRPKHCFTSKEGCLSPHHGEAFRHMPCTCHHCLGSQDLILDALPLVDEVYDMLSCRSAGLQRYRAVLVSGFEWGSLAFAGVV